MLSIDKLINHGSSGRTMHEKHYRNGSAEAVIIGVLVIALVGALGYIFYQRINEKSADTTKPSTSVTENKTQAAPIDDTPKQPTEANLKESAKTKVQDIYNTFIAKVKAADPHSAASAMESGDYLGST